MIIKDSHRVTMTTPVTEGPVTDENWIARYQEALNSHTEQQTSGAITGRWLNQGDVNAQYTRERNLRCGVWFAVATVVLSLISLACGIASCILAIKFPHISGGGIVMGVTCLVTVVLYFCVYKDNTRLREENDYDIDQRFKRCLVIFFVGIGFACVGVSYAFATSGVWALADCDDKKKGGFIRTCVPDENLNANLALAAITLVCSLVLTILLCIISKVFCCSAKQFEIERDTDYTNPRYVYVPTAQTDGELSLSEINATATTLEWSPASRSYVPSSGTLAGHSPASRSYVPSSGTLAGHLPTAPPHNNTTVGQNLQDHRRVY